MAKVTFIPASEVKEKLFEHGVIFIGHPPIHRGRHRSTEVGDAAARDQPQGDEEQGEDTDDAQ